MKRTLGELITFKDARSFHHDGIIYYAHANRCTIVHVHGSFGNFYQNGFLRIMAEVYLSHGINFLSFNFRAHDALAEGYRREWDFEYVGGAVAEFSECIEELQAAIDYVMPINQRIVLQGHSIGCDRILHYLLSTGSSNDFVLLSPCDSYALQTDWLMSESVESQVSRLMQVSGATEMEWLPLSEYGIRRGDWEYPIPITRKALLSILKGPPFELVNIRAPKKFFLDQRALIYIGGDDTLQTSPREEMIAYFKQRVRHVEMTAFYPEGDHSLWECERSVAEEIAAWALRSSSKPENNREH